MASTPPIGKILTTSGSVRTSLRTAGRPDLPSVIIFFCASLLVMYSRKLRHASGFEVYLLTPTPSNALTVPPLPAVMAGIDATPTFSGLSSVSLPV